DVPAERPAGRPRDRPRHDRPTRRGRRAPLRAVRGMSGRLLRHVANEEKRARRLPPGAVCAACRGTRLLEPVGGEVRCYQHLGGADPRIEHDHVAGRRNLPNVTLPVDANINQERVGLLRYLEIDELPYANGNPVLAAAHFLIGLATYLLYLGRWLV